MWNLRHRLLTLVLSAVTLAATAQPAAAQSMTDVLSFLLTNRSIPTGDFIRDDQAAAATRDAISAFLVAELGTLPSSSSSSGFTYRLDPELGVSVRSSDSFGPLFTERSLTAGAGQLSIGLSYQYADFFTVDGRNLRDDTLVATASALRVGTEVAEVFDIETLTLRLATRAVTIQGNLGVTDRLDIGLALPLITVDLAGERIDTYRGVRTTQASAEGSSSGLGDAIVRAKYNLIRRGAAGFALGGEARLPTGSKQSLRGTGDLTLTPRAIISLEHEPVAVHGTFGYVYGGASEEFDYSGAATYAVTPRLTVVGEAAGRRLQSIGRLTYVTSAHPRLAGVQTVRLTSTDQATTRVVAMAGVRWNLHSTWLLSASVLRSMTDVGLNARWIPTITLDHSLDY